MSGCLKPDGIKFDIPEGKASETFLEYAYQAKVEINFDPQSVRDIKTHSVSGFMDPTQALERMIDGTGLSINTDPIPDAIVVKINNSGLMPP